MKPYLPLTLAVAIGLASGTLAQTGSHKFPQGQSRSTQTENPRIPAEFPAPAASSATQSTAGPAAAASSNSTSIQRPAEPLQISSTERDYFEFGYALSKAAFGYADVAKQSLAIQLGKDRMQQIKLLAALAPSAERDRMAIGDSLNRTVAKMRVLHASRSALSVVLDAATRLNRPLDINGAAKDLSALSPDAGKTLASLNEFERISGLTESPEIAAWLKGSHRNRVGNVWYAEGLIAGVAEVASAQDMPELLPNIGEIATDLRGLRDWLQLRTPDPPSPAQTALGTALDEFLASSSASRHPDRRITHAELVTLGSISRQLQAEVLVQTASTN